MAFLFFGTDSYPNYNFDFNILWLKIFEKSMRRADSHWETHRFHRISSTTPRRRFFWSKLEKSKINFSRFQGHGTQILLKIKRPNRPSALGIYGQINPFLSPICGGVDSGINRYRKPLQIKRIFSLQTPYNLTYQPQNHVRRMGTYSGQVL